MIPVARRCIPSIAAIEQFEEDAGDGVKKPKLKVGVLNLISFFNAKEVSRSIGVGCCGGIIRLYNVVGCLQNLELLFQDLKASWVIILAFLGIGAVVGLIWICAMRFFAGMHFC